MARSNEPFFWGLFAAGGMTAALFLPITILITSVGIASGLVTQEKLWAAVTHPVGRIYLFTIIALPLFHWAHRFRFTLKDIGFKALDDLLAWLCYGFAVAGTIAAAFLAIRM